MHSTLTCAFFFITAHLCGGLAESTPTSPGQCPELTLIDNQGLHAFTYHGSFADDISFGKLPFLKLMGR